MKSVKNAPEKSHEPEKQKDMCIILHFAGNCGAEVCWFDVEAGQANNMVAINVQSSMPGGEKRKQLDVACVSCTARVTAILFYDVSKKDWFYDDVLYVYYQNWMYGIGNNRFAPKRRLTRGMLAAILYRLAHCPFPETPCAFLDVPPDHYSATAIAWAVKRGFLTGYDGAHFGVNDPITREQLVTILYRYAGHRGVNVDSSTALDPFADTASIHEDAIHAMQWAAASGLIKGTGHGRLAPKDFATRGQTAAILRRFLCDR